MPQTPVQCKPAYQESIWANPACIRFGDQDPRTWHFNWILLYLEDGADPEDIAPHLDALRRMGFNLNLTERSKIPPVVPIMTREERKIFDAGGLLPWMHPNFVAGGDQ